MLGILSELGERLVGLFGDSNLGIPDKHQADKLKAQIFSGSPFSKILPYVAFDQDDSIFINNSSCGFVVEAIPLVGGDADAYKIFNNLFQEEFQEGSSIQCLLWADHRIDAFLDTWEKSRKGEIHATMAKNRVEFFKKQTFFSPRLFRFFFSYSIPLGKDINASKKQLVEIREKIVKSLKSMTYVFNWKPKDLLETIGGLVNFNFSTEVMRRNWNQFENLSNQIPTGGELSIHENCLSWGDEVNDPKLKTFRVVDTPSQWPPIAMQALIGDIFRDTFQINQPFFIHYGIHFPKQSTVENSFWRKSHLIENQGKSHALIRMIPELAEELRECDYIRRSTSKGYRFVWTQLSAGIWANSQNMQQATQSIKNLFKINQFRLEENACIHLPQFLSILPMAWGEYANDLKNLNVLKTTISTECPCFIPIQGEWTGTSSANGVLMVGRRGQLMNWNPFDNTNGNYNCIVVGTSSSGKSVFMQDMMVSGLSMGANVYIIDVGRSFEKTCQILDGQYIEFSGKTNICLNPFSEISLDHEEERDTYFSFLKSIISCMAAPNQGTTDLENSLIEMAIKEVWESKKNESTVTDIADWLKAHQDNVAKNLGIMLGPYSSGGSYARYFDGKNNVNFANSLVLIELEELKNKPDLQTVVLQLFIMTIANKAFLGDRMTPFFICIDEAWDLLRAKQTEKFIETLARRLRKYRGSLVVGTQSMDDFHTTPGAKAAYENSDWVCLLAQKDSGRNNEFSDSKQRMLESIVRAEDYREIMICNGQDNYSICRLTLDPFSRLLYSTKAEEFARIKELQNAGKTIVEAIQQALKEKGMKRA